MNCPGYGAVLRWSDKYEVFRNNQQNPDRRRTAGRIQRRLSSTGRAEVEATPLPHHESNAVLSTSPALQSEPPSAIPDDGYQPLELSSGNYNSFVSLTDGNAQALATPFSLSSAADSQALSGSSFDGISLLDVDFWNTLTLPWPSETECLNYAAPALSEPSASIPEYGSLASAEEHPVFDPLETSDEDCKVLFQNYFENLCTVYCVFDSADNPFRYLVARYIRSSPLIRNCVLSMSAMLMCQDDSALRAKVVQYNSEALKLLATTIERLDTTPACAEQASSSRRESPTRNVEHLQEALLALLLLSSSSVST